MLQKEEERLRASIRRESQQRRVREKAHQRGLNANYLVGEGEEEDDEDDENSFSISALKDKYKKGGAGGKRKSCLIDSLFKNR